MNKIKLFLFFIISSQSIFGQEINKTEEAVHGEIMLVIQSLFDGMKESDSVKVSNCFHDDAMLRSSYLSKKTGNPEMHSDGVAGFLSAIAEPKSDIWDERISNIEIRIDDNLADVWMDYSFYLNDSFSHCGVNSIQLIKNIDGWKISAITDTRRKDNCNN